MLGKWINKRQQTCTNLIFTCNSPSGAQGRESPTLEKLWTILGGFSSPHDEIILFCHHPEPNIWKLSYSWQNHISSAKFIFSLICALFSFLCFKCQSRLIREYDSNKGMEVPKYWRFAMLPLLKEFVFIFLRYLYLKIGLWEEINCQIK